MIFIMIPSLHLCKMLAYCHFHQPAADADLYIICNLSQNRLLISVPVGICQVDIMTLSTTPTGIFCGCPSFNKVVKNKVTRIGKKTMQNRYTGFRRKIPHSRRVMFQSPLR